MAQLKDTTVTGNLRVTGDIYTNDLQIFSGKTANYIFAAPNGSNGAPLWRQLVTDDIPTITKSKISDFPTNLNEFTNGPGYVTSSGVTSITLKAGAGISLDTNNTAITDTGERTISIKDINTSTGSTSKWLNQKGNWSTPTASEVSAITKLSSSTDNAIVRFNGESGQVQNSGIIIDDNDNLIIGNNIIRSTFSDGSGDLILALGYKSGYPVYDDPTFLDGTNKINFYNNNGGGTVTVTRDTYDNFNISSPGTGSNYVLQIKTTGTAGPGHGGFIQSISSHANATFIQIFRALVPEGRTLATAANPMGANVKDQWLTKSVGTGRWEWYVRRVICGATGSFSSGGHIYINNGAAGTTDNPIIWYLGYSEVYDVTKAQYDGLWTRYADQAVAAKLTTTANAIAYYTDTNGTFNAKASANGALYATKDNGTLSWGTLPIAQGGTGKTTASDAANALISNLPTWTASPTADTYFIRRDTGGSASFGQVKFSSIANITNGVINLGPYNITPVTSVNGHTGSSVTVTAEDLNLSKAMRFIGVATVEITDDSTTDPVIDGYTTKTAGDVIIDSTSSREYVWSTAEKWELLGGDSSYWVSSTGTTAQFWRGDNSWTNELSGSAGNGQQVLLLKTSATLASGQYTRGINHLAQNMVAGSNTTLVTGQSNSKGNTAYFGFYFAGNNNANNHINIGLHSYNELVKIYPSGKMVLTNALQFPTTSAAYTNGIQFMNAATKKGSIGVDNDGVVGIYSASKIVLRPLLDESTKGVEITSSAMYPTASITLGTSTAANKWSTVYATTFDGTTASLTHAAGKSDGLKILYSSTIDFFVGVGTGNANHGLYDNKASGGAKWILYAGSDNTWTFSGNAETATTATTATAVGSGSHSAAVNKNEFSIQPGQMTLVGNVSNTTMTHTSNANAEMIIKAHPTSNTNYYEARLGFSSDKNLYYMPVNDSNWKQIAYISDIEALDVSNISGFGTTKTLATLTETDGKINATFQDITFPVTSVAGKTGDVTLVKGDVGLGNVDNTADANKSVNYATSAGSLSNFVISTYTIPPEKGVRIKYPGNVPVIISIQRNTGGSRLLLIGGGYGEQGTVRNDFTELVSSSTSHFTWSMPQVTGYPCTIEIMHHDASGNATVVVWTSAACTFTEITSLITDATNRTLLHSKNTTAPETVPTLSWNTESTIFTLNGTDVKIKAMTKPTYAFSDLTAPPTTLSGYGITDAATSNHTHGNISNTGTLTNKNCLVWTDSTGAILSGNHYASTTKIAINSATAPTENFYVSGSSAFNGLVTVNTNITSGTCVTINNTETITNSNSYVGLAAMASKMAANSNIYLSVGKEAATKNRGYLGFHYTADSSDANYLTMGLNGTGTILAITGAGRVGIGTTSPTVKFEVNGAVKMAGGAITMQTNVNQAITISSGSTIWLNKPEGSSIVFTSGGADTNHEYGRFNTQGMFQLGASGTQNKYKLYVHGDSAFSGKILFGEQNNNVVTEYAYMTYNSTDNSIDFMFA